MWGFLAKVSFQSFKRPNLLPKFVGYAENNASYRFTCLENRSMCESRDVGFFERIFSLKNAHNVSIDNPLGNEHALFSTSCLRNDFDQPIRSKRLKTEKRRRSFCSDFITFVTELKDINEIL